MLYCNTFVQTSSFMKHLLHSGKFWLKTAFFSLITITILTLSLYVLLYHIFHPDKIQNLANQILQSNNRHVRFDAKIGRSWLPRPTLTLQNITISEPNSDQPAIYIKESKIGLAWKNLWSNNLTIEKWGLSGINATVSHTPKGSWNIQDLWQKVEHSPIQLNRILIADSRINLQLPQGNYTFKNFGLNLQSSQNNSRAFNVTSTIDNDKMLLQWQGNGILKTISNGWTVPNFHLDAQGRLNNETLQLRAESALTLHPNNNNLQAQNISLQADSSFQQLHLTAQSPLLNIQNDHININELRSAFTANLNDNQLDGSLSLDKANLHSNIATLNNFELNGSHKTKLLQTTFTASGPLTWQQNNGLQSSNLHITTHQDTIDRLPKPRFISLLEGSIHINSLTDFQGQFKGLFDRQPTALVFKYTALPKQTPHLEAGVAIQKLVLTPYWEDLQAQSGQIYPSFLNHSSTPEIEARLKINSIIIPNLQLDDVETLLSANRQHITLSDFKAALYGGHTEGGISMSNTQPITYHLQQNAQNVQTRPLLQDLFGFHNISGVGNAVIDVTTQGENRNTLTKNLNGSFMLNVTNGAWVGIDINNVLKDGNITQNNPSNVIPQTPFRRLTLNSSIQQGISKHNNTEIFSDYFHIISHGYTDLNKQNIAEELLIYNMRDRSAKPIPLKISGSVKNPSITINFNRLTNGLKTPEEKQKALSQTLKEQWKWLNPNK